MTEPVTRPLTLVAGNQTLDTLLAEHAEALGDNAAAYTNHCYRVLNFALALSSDEVAGRAELFSIALAYHDLAIWTHGTLDYLDPSADLAQAYLEQRGKPDWIAPVRGMIEWHHKLRPYRGPHAEFVEPIRRADLVDVSLGRVQFGLPKTFVTAVRARFPNAGFHRLLLKLSGQRLLHKPWSPLPILRW